jgi:hypothetical protein
MKTVALSLAPLLGTDLLGARERPFQYDLEIGVPGDFAADIANEVAEPRAQQTQLAMITLELLGVGHRARHHRGAFGDSRIRLAQLQPAFAGHPIKPLDRRMQQLGISREGDRFGLARRVHRDPLMSRVCRALSHAPRASSQPAGTRAWSRAPSSDGSGRALRREFVLEKFQRYD